METEEARKEYPPGSRIELISMNDPQAPAPGSRGTVYGVDAFGDLEVNWDNGGALNVCLDVDRVRKIAP